MRVLLLSRLIGAARSESGTWDRTQPLEKTEKFLTPPPDPCILSHLLFSLSGHLGHGPRAEEPEPGALSQAALCLSPIQLLPTVA